MAGVRVRRAGDAVRLPRVEASELARRLAALMRRSPLAATIPAELLSDLAAIWPTRDAAPASNER
jgi:hypothetical protein